MDHILIVTYSAHGHLNPAIHLARRLAAYASVTLSTPIPGHRRMFPSSPSSPVHDGLLSYVPFSDGFDQGRNTSIQQFLSISRSNGSKSLAGILTSLAGGGRPVTSVVYTFLLPWVSRVAKSFDIPSTLFWIQPATVFAVYYHYFHGFRDVILENSRDPDFVLSFPGLKEMKMSDLPSFVSISDAEHPHVGLMDLFRENFEALESAGCVVLVNTFEELESEALGAVKEFRLVGVGPSVGAKEEEGEVVEWLESKAEKSAVYVSFGSLAVMSTRQMEEVVKGMAENGSPWIWVVRKNNREEEGVEEMLGRLCQQGNCLVVDWCSQFQVLSHPSIGCFVTHCGWNSMLDSLTNGVPMVAVPQWSDQATNAWLLQELGLGVRAKLNEGILEAPELKQCLEMIMGEGSESTDIRRKAKAWSDKAHAAITEGGQSYQNIKDFINKSLKY